MEETIRINKNRLAVVIGPNGRDKRNIEKKVGVALDIDSHTGEITIISNKSYYEIHVAKNIINAIARGFSPERAFKLLNDNYSLEIIHIFDFVKESKERLIQIKGRIIGRDGKIKNLIEKKGNCFLSIYGKTVSIIAEYTNIEKIRNVIEKILSGTKHTVIFKMLNSSRDQKFKRNNTKEIDNIDFK